ncbi:unnamed protein product [Symbiodinium natans]|uniref:Methyltransferase FkbM domain-containing protein n=1 Tax=Symbiodinium natans TaxID=878477 RepID=A0A812IEZ2_9DINO|nr:unnamed protein product [Symbiodinium natans]
MVNMAKCARAMLAMAVLANVVDVTSLGPNNETSTCSTAAVHERYPVRDALERRVLDLEQDRQHKAWWRAAYHRHSHLGSGWEFQHKGAKLLRLLANHTAMCGALGYTCAVYNPWEPRRCFSHHPLVKAWSPSCGGGSDGSDPWRSTGIPRIPRRPPRVRKSAADWLGLHQDCQEGLESQLPQTQPEMTRMLECAGVAWGPVAGEDYFETISLLRAVTSATSFTNFVVVEVGSGIGYWAPKAAKAFRRRFPHTGSCHVVLIESLVPTASAAANLQRNGIYELCNVTFYQSAATAQLLDSLIQSFGAVDLVHVDIQEAELELVKRSILLPKVQHLFIGTHGRLIHREVRTWLVAHGFSLDFDYVGKSFLPTAYGPVVFGDGVLAARKKALDW